MAVDDTIGGSTRKAASQTSDAPVIVDLGKQKKKKVKALRQGTGELMDEVRAAIGEIQRAGRISSQAQPVIIVVTEKPKAKKFPMMFR
jgi:hypothetical protein